MKYLVVECHKGYAVLLDENASFVNSANLGYEVGQTVSDPVLMDSGKIKTNRRIITVSRLIAAAACLVLVSGIFLYRRNHAVYSEITISDNVCMQVNRKGEVITVESLNSDGEKLLENYQAEGKNQLDATEEIIKKAIETGSIQDGDTVSLYVDTPEQDSFFDCKTEFEEHFRSEHGFKVNVKKYNHKNSTKSYVSATSAPPYTQQENTAPPQENVTPYQSGDTPYQENVTPYQPSDTPYEQDPDINSQKENFSDFNNETHEKNRNFSDSDKNNENHSDLPDRNENNENYNNHDNHDNNFSDFNNDTNENYDNFYDSDKNNYRENQNQDFNQDFSPEYQENQGHHGGHSR